MCRMTPKQKLGESGKDFKVAGSLRHTKQKMDRIVVEN